MRSPPNLPRADKLVKLAERQNINPEDADEIDEDIPRRVKFEPNFLVEIKDVLYNSQGH